MRSAGWPPEPVPEGGDGARLLRTTSCRWGWRKPGQSAEDARTAPGEIALFIWTTESLRSLRGPLGRAPLCWEEKNGDISRRLRLVRRKRSKVQNDGGTDQAGWPASTERTNRREAGPKGGDGERLERAIEIGS